MPNDHTLKNALPFERIKREILVKRQAKTDPKFGEEANNRSVKRLLDYGVVNVNKCKGPTSHQISAYVQGILGIKKSGHSGTLDPKVTGVLPVAIGRGTRAVEMLLSAGKEYVCLMHTHALVEEEELRKVIKSFVGKIKQLPPIKSAVKRDWRYRKIYYIDILEIDKQDVLFRVGCQAGTYIRKLCHDIGVKAGTNAHMAELVRTKAGPFNTSTRMVTLDDLRDAFWYYENEGNEKYLRHCIQPVESAVRHLPKIWVLDSTVNSLCHGMDLKAPGIVKVDSEMQVDEQVAVMTLKEELIAVGKVKMTSKEMLAAEKGIVVSINKVFMEPGLYPRVDRAMKTETEKK